jgi:hypothetical protein
MKNVGIIFILFASDDFDSFGFSTFVSVFAKTKYAKIGGCFFSHETQPNEHIYWCIYPAYIGAFG